MANAHSHGMHLSTLSARCAGAVLKDSHAPLTMGRAKPTTRSAPSSPRRILPASLCFRRSQLFSAVGTLPFCSAIPRRVDLLAVVSFAAVMAGCFFAVFFAVAFYFGSSCTSAS